MSVGVFPQYNSGKVIGEINWLEPISVSATTSSTYPKIFSDEIVIPINRKDLNEVYFGFWLDKTSSANELVDIAKIERIDSSEQNNESANIVGFLRKTEIGTMLEIRSIANTEKYMSFILISEQANSFVIQLKFRYNTSTNMYIAGIAKLGWR